MIPETTQKTLGAELVGKVFPMRRPLTLAACARIGARRYRRQRDLPGAVRGLLAGDDAAILPRLIIEEQRCEKARRGRTAEYRPGQHVQILAALLAEAAAACPELADGARAPQPVPPCVTLARGARSPGPAIRQAKASGSEALRSAM